MEVNRVNSNQSFGALYGDAGRIMKELGKNAMKVVMEQKKNDVADVFVNGYRGIKIKARPGYKIPLKRYDENSKMVDELDVTFRRQGDGFMARTDYLECITPEGERVSIGIPRCNSLDYNDPTELYGALSVAEEAYRHAKHGFIPHIFNIKEDMEKCIKAIMNVEI